MTERVQTAEGHNGTVLFYGYNPDLAIYEIASRVFEHYRDGACLMTLLDGCSPVEELQPLMSMLQAKAARPDEVRFVQGAALVSGNALHWALTAREVLVSYSELYLFDQSPTLSRSPRHYYTSLLYHLDEEYPAEIISYMIDNRASGYCSDGEGLNYVFTDDRFRSLSAVLTAAGGASLEN